MFYSQTAKMLFVATIVLFVATSYRLEAAGLELVRGPWLIERQSGGLRIGIEVLPHRDELRYGLVQLKSRDEAFLLSNERMLAAVARGRVVLTFELTAQQRREQAFLEIHGVHAKPIPLALKARPRLLNDVQVAFAGAYNYPRAEDLARLENQMGKDIQLVILLGAGTATRVGSGGWESRIPILAIPDNDTTDAFSQFVFGNVNEWRLGAQWGCLGLPSAMRDEDVLKAINRGVCNWQIFLDAESRWDPGLMGDPANSISQLSDLLSVCSRKQLPLIIGSGSGSGFISEPLAVFTSQFSDMALRKKYVTELQLKSVQEDVKESGRPVERVMVERAFMTQKQVIDLIEEINIALLHKKSIQTSQQGVIQQSGGTRYIPSNIAGIGFKAVNSAMAMPLYRPGLLGIQATERDCLVHVTFADALPIQLRYSNDEDVRSTGWADYEIKEDLLKLRNEKTYDKSLSEIQWHLSTTLAQQLNTSSFELKSMLDWSMGQEDGVGTVLMRRLTQMDKTILLSWLHQTQDVPQEVRRDCFLRCLDDATVFSNSDFQYIITHQTDEFIISGLLARMKFMQRDRRLSFIDILIKRLQLQANGQVALDVDPILQQSLMSCIFESPYHSPTQLRPLAHFMRKNGHNLAVGVHSPIQRFFDRYGE